MKARHIIYTPIVYLFIIPLIITDIFLTLYINLGLPLLKIKKPKRKNYIKIDRHKIKKLKPIQKINCAYCGYANGLIMYLQKTTAITEKYWCPIKHKSTKNFIEPKHHKNFKKYSLKQTL